ncbi:MAG TPA: hypothetical protein VIM11_10725 [Tepidisphaeraceae bacterium]
MPRHWRLLHIVDESFFAASWALLPLRDGPGCACGMGFAVPLSPSEAKGERGTSMLGVAAGGKQPPSSAKAWEPGELVGLIG